MNFWLLFSFTVIPLLIVGIALLITSNSKNYQNIGGVMLTIAIIAMFVFPLYYQHEQNSQKYNRFICVEIIGKYEIQRDWVDYKDCIVTQDLERYFVHYPDTVKSVYLAKKSFPKLFGFIEVNKTQELFTIPTTDKDKVRRLFLTSCKKTIQLKE